MTSTKNHEDIESLLTIIAEKNDLSSSVLSFLKKIRSPPEVLLIGESTHSSIELFKLKFDIALKCIDDDELNFSAILLEADVLPCSSLNRLDTDSDSDELDASRVIYSLETECKRFPQWLWKNKETVDFMVQILILSRKRRRDISSKSSSLNTRIIALMGKGYMVSISIQ
jgi:erythromycin esterase-like protein